MTQLAEVIKDAIRVKNANNLSFATIWKTGETYGFNFDKKEIGFTHTDNGVKRTVVKIV